MGISMGLPYFVMKNNFDVSKIAIFSTNFKLYKDMSDRVMDIIEEFSPEIDVYSIDEAFIDLSHVKNPQKFCEELQRKIKQYTGIPVSIGIAPTKTLAKLSNRTAKDNKVVVYQMEGEKQIEEILKNTSVGKIWGIGSRISLELSKFGIDSAFKLTQQSDQWIQKNFGIGLLRLTHELKGVSCLSMESIKESRKSIISSRSFGKATGDFKNLFSAVSFHIANAAQQMREEGNATKFMSISIYTDRHRNVPQHSETKSIVLLPYGNVLKLSKFVVNFYKLNVSPVTKLLTTIPIEIVS
jgi:DNA polymerase V